MTAINRIFICAIVFCVSLGAAIGVFLYASLFPYFGIIGKAAAALVMLFLGCAGALLLSFTYNKVRLFTSKRKNAQMLERVVIVGDLAAYQNYDGTWEHLSAIHEHAKLPPAPVTVKEVQATTQEEQVLEYFQKGVTLRNIAAVTGLTYYQVQKITSGK